MITLADVDAVVDDLSRRLAAEEGAIVEAIASRSLGDGRGYWEKAHALRERLRVAQALRDVLQECLPPQ